MAEMVRTTKIDSSEYSMKEIGKRILESVDCILHATFISIKKQNIYFYKVRSTGVFIAFMT